MTDQEINEAVARKLGWDCCYRLDAVGWHRKLTPQGNHFHEPMPDYCHSIEAAWEIVEKIPHCTIYFADSVHKWKVSWLQIDGSDTTPWVGADTAPMSICLAFLKLP